MMKHETMTSTIPDGAPELSGDLRARVLDLEKRAALGDLVASVAHRLNNQLTSLQGYADLLEEDVCELASTDARLDEIVGDVQRLRSQVEHVSAVVGGLVGLGRGARAGQASHDVPQICESVLMLAAYSLRSAGIEHTTHVDPNLPAVRGDIHALRQLFLLLLLAGQRTLEARQGDRQMRFSLQTRDACVRVDITVNHCFEALTSSDATRLEACADIARAHGGELRVQCTPTDGTRFLVDLPA